MIFYNLRNRIHTCFRKQNNFYHLPSIKTPCREYSNQFCTVQRGSLNTIEYRLYFRNNDQRLISPFHDIPLGVNNNTDENSFNMVVEVPRWSNAKMEVATKEPLNPIKQDTKNGSLRFVGNCFPFHGYIWNYGTLPQTWENPEYIHPATSCPGDNDPIDVCEIGNKIHFSGAVVPVKILGCIALIDSNETDWKLLAIDVTDPLAHRMNDVMDIEKLNPGYLKATVEWFRNYKIPQGQPKNNVGFNGNPQNVNFSMSLIEETHQAWHRLMNKEFPNVTGLALENTSLSQYSSFVKNAEAECFLNANIPMGQPVSVDEYVNSWHYFPTNNR